METEEKDGTIGTDNSGTTENLSTPSTVTSGNFVFAYGWSFVKLILIKSLLEYNSLLI